MAIKNIDPLIDSMTPDQEQEALLSTATADVEEASTENPLETPSLDPADDSVFTGEEQQVAVLGPFRQILKQAPKRTAEAPTLTKPEAVSPEMAEAIKVTEPEMPVTGKPPETVFNLNRIQGPDELKQHIEAVAQASGAGDIGKVNFDEIASKAIADGYDQKFVDNIINRSRRIEADPAQVYKMMLALADAQKRTFELSRKVDAAAMDGTLTDDLVLEFRQALALEGVLAKGAKQKQADIARSLAIFGKAREGDVTRGVEMNQVVTAMGGRGDFVALARAYSSSPGKAQRATIAERALGSRAKDIWMTTWINGILSSPVTHVKNMTANTLYMGLSFAEKQTASLIGQSRRLLFGSEDIIRQEEIFVDMYSMVQGIREGATLARSAWKQNQQITGLSKVEYRTIDDPFNISVAPDASEFEKAAAKGFGYWGKFVTAPGRALMAEDEFFKAINYRRSINTLAYREHKTYLNELIATGKYSPDEAKALADQRMVDVLSNPPDEIHREALDFAGEMTFTKDLEGKLASMERIAQHPLAKMYVPFIRTPTNIAIELNKRTPAAFLSKRVRDDWAAGGIKRDMVVARATLGSGMMIGIGSMALDGEITGAGPYRKEDKDVLKAQGWQPYSIVLDKSDVDDAQLAEFQKHTQISVGPDKVYVSYMGLEPVGALMGIGATVGEYAMLEPDADAMEKLFTGAGIGVSDYMSELPVVSGLNELMTTFRGRGKEGTDYLLSIFSNFTQQVSEVAIGGSPMGAYSSMLAYTNRILEPELKSPLPTVEDYSDLNPAFKGFMDSLAMYYNRNPYLSPDRPGRLDSITGERTMAPMAPWMRAFPFRISTGRYSPAHEILDVFGVGQYQPKKRFDGVELNAQQYNRLIELATQEPWFSNGNNLELELTDLANDERFLRFAEEDAEAAKEVVKDIVETAYRNAREMMKEEDPNLSIGIDALKFKETMRTEQRVQQRLQ